MRTFVFRHGKGSILHNRYNGHRKPTVTKTIRPDGSVCRFSCDWHSAIREERYMGLARKQAILAAADAELMRDAADCFCLPALAGESLVCYEVADGDGVDFGRKEDGQLDWASYGEEGRCPVHFSSASCARPLQPWKRPLRSDYVRAARALC